jgi:hypothetical protein
VTREDLTPPAVQTSATIEIVDPHPALQRAGGVGALLRYRPG